MPKTHQDVTAVLQDFTDYIRSVPALSVIVITLMSGIIKSVVATYKMIRLSLGHKLSLTGTHASVDKTTLLERHIYEKGLQALHHKVDAIYPYCNGAVSK